MKTRKPFQINSMCLVSHIDRTAHYGNSWLSMKSSRLLFWMLCPQGQGQNPPVLQRCQGFSALPGDSLHCFSVVKTCSKTLTKVDPVGFEMSNTLYKCLLWQPSVAVFGFWVFILFCPKTWGHEVGWLLRSWVAEGLLVPLGLGWVVVAMGSKASGALHHEGQNSSFLLQRLSWSKNREAEHRWKGWLKRRGGSVLILEVTVWGRSVVRSWTWY